MVDQRTRVLYQALADFSALTREVREAKREIRELKRAEDDLNTSSARNTARAGQARADATKKQSDAQRVAATMAKRMTDRQTALDAATRLTTDAIQRQNRALSTNAARLMAAAAAANAYAQSQRGISRNANNATTNVQQASPLQRRSTRPTFQPAAPTMSAAQAAQQYAQNAARAQQATTRWGRSVQWLQGQFRNLTPAMQRTNSQATVLQRNFQRFANWRPRLTPPFVALIPIIAAVVAAINPLVALLGAVGTAAFGLTANIASLSGAFLALPGILSAVVGGIASVIASMGGVGNVFKTYSAMQKATTKGGGGAGAAGETQAERADRLARAEYNLAKAQRAVQKAQQNLNKARQQALEDLIDLRLEVERASINEDRAIANLAQARDNYNNVMADPSSQAGDKLDAAVAIREAEADLADVRRRNAEAQQELIDAERKGIENSDRVLDAKEDLQDAIYSEKDAQKSLSDEYKGGTAAANALATATDEYNEALAKLSPSARAVVLALIGLQDEWNAMRSDLQENFFSQFVGDMDKLPKIIQNIGNFLRPAARAMGRFVSALITLLSSPEWSRDLAKIGEENGKVIDNLGRGFLALITFFKDLIIAAAPFTDWLTGAFADGLENLRDLLDTDPEKQGLAAWLETVRGRLEKWWAIVKNVGTTLFNYGVAASGFGDWLSDGFLQTTENWKAASERAKEDGSPFKQFLEDIQPLLSNVNGLIGDFFGWLSQEIMDPANIEDANDLVTLLRDDLGPALGDFLDALAETDIDEKIVEAISAIIRSLTEVIEAGGGAGFEAFFDVIVGFFEALADILSQLDEGSVSLLLSVLGGLAALSFIGKFTGITNLVGGLLSLVGGKSALTGIFGGLKKLSGLKFAGLVGPAGVITGILALAVASFNAAPKQQEYNKSLTDFMGTPTQENYDNYRDTATKDGNFIKNLGNVPGTNFGAMGPLTNSLPIVTELLHGFDDLFGTDIGTQFENWLEDASNAIFDWIEGSPLHSFLTDLIENWDIDSFNETVNTELGNFFEDTGINFTAFFEGVGTGWNEFWGTTVPTAWTTFTTWLSTEWNNFWTGLSSWIDTTFVQPVLTAWGNFQLGLQIGWAWIDQNVLQPFNRGVQAVATWFDTTFVQPIERAWAGFQTNLQAGWLWINTYVFDPFKRGIDGVRTWFDQGVNGLQTTWNRIQDIFKNPVRFVVDTVYNGGILPFWNTINDALRLNMRLNPVRLGFKEGGVLPGYNPGVDNHHFVDQNGNRLDLGGGEGILVPQATRMLGGKAGIDAINRDAKSGRQAFAKGGVFGGTQTSARKPGTGGPWEEITRFAGDVFNNFGRFFSDPIGFVTREAGKIVDPLLRQVPDAGNFSEILKSMPGKIIGGLGNFAKVKADQGNKQREQDMAGGGPAPANVMGWQAQWAAVKKAFPGASLNSAYRPGAITVNGGQSYHGLGRAIDVTPSMAIFNWLKQNYPNSRELIYSPANGRQLLNGREYFWPDPVRSQHFDHVHWAMRKGGVFEGAPAPKVYDRGGWINPGETGINLTRKPEAVLTNDESRGLKALLDGVGLSRGPAGLGLSNSVGSLQGAAQQIIDNSINVEKLEINNPVPETPSVSLPKAIRQIGYMQNARSA